MYVCVCVCAKKCRQKFIFHSFVCFFFVYYTHTESEIEKKSSGILIDSIREYLKFVVVVVVEYKPKDLIFDKLIYIEYKMMMMI